MSPPHAQGHTYLPCSIYSNYCSAPDQQAVGLALRCTLHAPHTSEASGTPPYVV
jgi:hypothetical protein